MAVWYGGGKARAPMLERDARSKKELWRKDVQAIKQLGFNTLRAWIDWASGELLGALRQKPELCSSFDWTKIHGYGFSPSAQVAVHYLRFAQGDAFFGGIGRRCAFLTQG